MPIGTWRRALAIAAICSSAGGFRVPGVNYPAQIREDVSILPGGRALRPFGRQLMTGTAAFGIAIAPGGKTVVSANIGLSKSIGLDHPSITVIVPGKRNAAWTLEDFHADARRSDSKGWQGVTTGVAVVNDTSVWVSEGDTGRVVELNLSLGIRKNSVNLNSGPYGDSFTDALVFDPARNLLIALDAANFRVATIDPKRGLVMASAKTGVLPVALALAPDGKRLYVANRGAEPSVSIIDVTDAAAPRSLAEVPLPEDSAPAGIAAAGDQVYVSLSHRDAIAIVDGPGQKLVATIELRIPGFEKYPGITPLGLARDGKTGLLLAAEAGINAVGVIDPAARKLLGHIPVGWFPDAIGVHDGQVYVASARGFGTGPSDPAHTIRMMGAGRQGQFSFELAPSALRRGSVSVFAVPSGSDLAEQTNVVMDANGFAPVSASRASKKVPPVRYVVLIEKGNRTFDEILGDMAKPGEKPVLGEPSFARFGSDGYVSGGGKHFSLHADVTPNHHDIADRWAFGDNFYADADYAATGRQWLAGVYPDFWSATAPLYEEAHNRQYSAQSAAPGRRLFSDDVSPAPIWNHLERHHIAYLDLSQENDAGISDQSRADRFIDTIRREYLDPGKPLPQFMVVRLPNDTTGPPNDDGFDYRASYVADNDYALGRIVDFLSHSPWWKQMAVFVTETAADDGADHIDSHRTLLLGAGPWFRSHYVTHNNASFPALLATVYKLLDVPPLSLYEASAGDLLDMFGDAPDFAPYDVKPEDPRLFDPQKFKSR